MAPYYKSLMTKPHQVDRPYHPWIDFLHHHISDCHVVHHLFYTKIPHYHLRQATDALVEFLKRENLTHVYKCRETPWYFVEIFRGVYVGGFRACLVSTDREGVARRMAENAEKN